MRPEFLGQRHEQPRVDQTADRVGPAHERLEADDAARVEVVDRLVVREEVAVVDRGAQFALLLNPRQHGGMHLLPVDLEAVLAALLRLVHGDVRVAQQLFAGDSRFVERDADAACCGGGPGSLRDGHAERFEDPLGQGRDVLAGPHVLNENGELVAAETRRGVERPEALGEVRRHPLEQLVSLPVPQAVVHRLEVVEVDEQHGQMGAGLADPGQGVLEAVLEQRLVGQPRQ